MYTNDHQVTPLHPLHLEKYRQSQFFWKMWLKEIIHSIILKRYYTCYYFDSKNPCNKEYTCYLANNVLCMQQCLMTLYKLQVWKKERPTNTKTTYEHIYYMHGGIHKMVGIPTKFFIVAIKKSKRVFQAPSLNVECWTELTI